MMTAMLPSSFLTSRQKRRAEPEWSRFGLWDRIRKQFLSFEPDERDRLGKGFKRAYRRGFSINFRAAAVRMGIFPSRRTQFAMTRTVN